MRARVFVCVYIYLHIIRREFDGMEELVRDTTVYMCVRVCVRVCMRVCVGGGIFVYVHSVYVAGIGWSSFVI